MSTKLNKAIEKKIIKDAFGLGRDIIDVLEDHTLTTREISNEPDLKEPSPASTKNDDTGTNKSRPEPSATLPEIIPHKENSKTPVI